HNQPAGCSCIDAVAALVPALSLLDALPILAAGGLERDAEGMAPGVVGREIIIGRQNGLAITAAEVHRARVARNHVAVSVLGSDIDRKSSSLNSSHGAAAHDESGVSGQIDGD